MQKVQGDLLRWRIRSRTERDGRKTGRGRRFERIEVRSLSVAFFPSLAAKLSNKSLPVESLINNKGASSPDMAKFLCGKPSKMPAAKGIFGGPRKLNFISSSNHKVMIY